MVQRHERATFTADGVVITVIAVNSIVLFLLLAVGWNRFDSIIVLLSLPSYVLLFFELYFTFVVVGGGLLGLSLVNAIFVDEMLRDETNSLDDHLVSITRQLDEVQGQLQLLLRARSPGSREDKPAPDRDDRVDR